MKRFDNLERTPWKLATGALADSDTSGGNVPEAAQTQPLIECASFVLNPRLLPYANAYWYKELGNNPKAASFTYHAAFLFPTPVDSQCCQALELDIQQSIKGLVFNFGFQLDFARGFVRLWDRGAHEAGQEGWQATGIPVGRWAEQEWLEITLGVHRSKDKVFYDSLILSGQEIPLGGKSFKAPKLSLSDMLNCAVQLDGNQAGEAYRVMMDAVSLITA